MLGLISIRGIRDRRLSSSAAHIVRKLLDEITANVLVTSVEANSSVCGRGKNIMAKKRVELFRNNLEGCSIPDFASS